MTKQIAVRIQDELAAELQDLVDRGVHETAAEAVRAGLRMVIAEERRRRVDEAIVDGYRRHPPTEADERWVVRSGREMVAEEPW